MHKMMMLGPLTFAVTEWNMWHLIHTGQTTLFGLHVDNSNFLSSACESAMEKLESEFTPSELAFIFYMPGDCEY